ncbi:hypothetical protein BLA29_003945, partial [Euroglyphus maynei]
MEMSIEKEPKKPSKLGWTNLFKKDDKIVNKSPVIEENQVVRRNRNRARHLLLVETLVRKLCYPIESDPELPNGKVNKVKHRFDEQQYAVKRIRLKQGQLNKLNRETIICAKLSHPNIVVYKTSWIQKCSSNNVDDHNLESTTSATQNSTAVDSIISKSICGSTKRKSKFFGSSSSSSSSSLSSSSIKKIESKMIDEMENPEQPTFLFIQMELCGQNLKDYIVKRNDLLKRTDKLDLTIELKWFEQILAGVQHMHKEQLIHRDLKPSNILFTLDGKHLKICDFGLSAWILESYDNHDPESLFDNDREKLLSFGMGTAPYAAPEQLSQSNYDHRVDIYSLGIILLELVYPLGSEMEKSKFVKQLKELRTLPQEFNDNDRYKNLGQLILAMTEKDAEKRIKTINLIERRLKKIRTQLKSKVPKMTALQQKNNEILQLKQEIARLQEENQLLKAEKINDNNGEETMK